MDRLLYQIPPDTLKLSHCIVAFNEGGPAFGFGPDQGPVSLDHCDVYGNEEGDWTAPIVSQLGQDGNICEDPLFCDLMGGDFHLATGSPCLPEATGDGELMGLYGWGCDHASSVPTSTIAGNLELLPNFPNPFNGRTTFRLILTGPEQVSVDIVDVSGRRVIRLMDEQLRPVGVTTLDWDGRDDRGRRVSTGIYLLQVRAGEHRLSRPVMFLK